MTDARPPHPDRLALTLALRARLLAEAGDGPFAPPGAGSADARVRLKQLLWAVREALTERCTDAARARFATVDSPDLVAGTVADATARGVYVALEETLSLCAAARAEPPLDEDEGERFEGKQLRRKRDLLVASGGARIRWSRKRGVLFVDRAHGVHEENCIRFEDRADRGDLDGFEADPHERPRLFSPAFLQPVELAQGPRTDRLVLAGRLGRRPGGMPCRVVLEGRKGEHQVRLSVAFRNDRDDHRLRIRFLGCRAPEAIGHRGTPGLETVVHRSRWFVAGTLVRACGRLRVGDVVVPVPDAQCRGWHHHEFRLGGSPWRTA